LTRPRERGPRSRRAAPPRRSTGLARLAVWGVPLGLGGLLVYAALPTAATRSSGIVAVEEAESRQAVVERPGFPPRARAELGAVEPSKQPVRTVEEPPRPLRQVSAGRRASPGAVRPADLGLGAAPSPGGGRRCDAVERCDGIDNDCDGEVDEAGAQRCLDLYFDDDEDGFGGSYAGCFCGPGRGLAANDRDCDDRRGDVHPESREICDGEVDNDCDGIVDLCEASSRTTLRPGDLVVGLANDATPGIPDRFAEWFTIENRSGRTVDLMGLEVRDDGVDHFRIEQSLVLPADAVVRLGRSGDRNVNGDVEVAYVYSDFVLSNAGDAVELRNEDVVIDRVVYGPTGDLVSGADPRAD